MMFSFYCSAAKVRLSEQKSKIILRFLERLRVGERSSGIREYLRPKVKERFIFIYNGHIVRNLCTFFVYYLVISFILFIFADK
jgi:hypothetical protein